jgi:hypothetical protein
LKVSGGGDNHSEFHCDEHRQAQNADVAELYFTDAPGEKESRWPKVMLS